MNHAQTMQANPVLEPSIVADTTTGRLVPCSGHLHHVESWPDRHVTSTQVVETLVSMYACRRCNHRIVVERIVAGEAVALAYAVLNDYLPVGPRQMVENLAGRMHSPS
jgi:hypothetical protein